MCVRSGFLAPLFCMIVVASLTAQRGPTRMSATIVGYVTARSTGELLGFADATIEDIGIGTFARSNGVFRLRGVPPGAVTLRVRRLGFTPVSLHLTVVEGREDTVRVALEPLAPPTGAHPRVRRRLSVARSPKCRYGHAGHPSPARDNAERNKLLAHESPFSTRMERAIGAPERVVSLGGNQRIHVTRVDTVQVAAEHEWRYEPGKLVVPTDGRREPRRRRRR